MKVCVIIPCYKVKDKIIKVLQSIPECITHIFVVDDCCPEQSGQYVLSNISDPRIEVIFHNQNQGVGGAVKTGFHHAINYQPLKIMVRFYNNQQAGICYQYLLDHSLNYYL